MKRTLFLSCTIVALASAPAWAVSFFDDFENGVQGSVWAKWPGSNQEILQTSDNHNITLGGSKSARAFDADPTGYNAFHDFGASSGGIRAEVYVFEDFTYTGPQPVTDMLALVGDNGTATPGFSTDYLQLGVVNFLPGGNTNYSTRSRNGGADNSTNTGVSRAAGWTKLAIVADALSAGGAVRYYINDALVGTSARSPGVDLRWVRLGNNSKNYQNFWYDNVSVTSVPEPSAIALVFAGVVGVACAMRKPTVR